MEVLKFNVSGKSAFFRSNEINTGDLTYTYGQIHKIALLGILGAITGLPGHMGSRYEKEDKYVHPEFYTKLKGVKMSIVPRGNGYFQRKIQDMVNNCGQTLMYREQWLENVSWDIYINMDTVEDAKFRLKLIDYIQNNKCAYVPYFGKVNHRLTISNVEILVGEICTKSVSVIDSLFISDGITKDYSAIFVNKKSLSTFEYREKLPMSYIEEASFYECADFIFSNKRFDDNGSKKFLMVNGLKLYFI